MAGIEDLTRWNPRAAVAAALVAAIAFATVWLLVWPTDLMYDDGAIVLRYMDNFADGHPYRYNADDPPVFGVSGFVHFTVAGAAAASGLFSPQGALLLSGWLGLVLSCVAMLLILRRFTESLLMVLMGSVFTLSASYFLLVNAYQGLEASLHLGIVLMACWAFLSGRWRTMWFLMALSIVSKLDATPVAAVLLVLRAVTLRSKREWIAEIRRAAIWGGLPLLAWTLFALGYFGSPLPQSAAAKVEFHYHPPRPIDFVLTWWKQDHPNWWIRPQFRIGVYWLAVLVGVLAASVRGGRAEAVRVLVMPLACAAVLGLYMIYNPGERMPWYYVMPQALLVLGAVCALFCALRSPRRLVTIALALAILGAVLPATVSKAQRRIRGDLAYIQSVEPERIAIGRFIHANAAQGDRLLTGHGYVAREARIHTHDMSGLNSPEVTGLRAEKKYLPEALQPDWVAFPALLPWATQRDFGYRLERTFYDRSARGHPAWRVWHREPGALVRAVRQEEITAELVEGGDRRVAASSAAEILLTPPAGTPVSGIEFGVARHAEALRLAAIQDGVTFADFEIPARDPADRATGRSAAVRLDLPDAGLPVRIAVARPDGSAIEDPMVMLEPVWLISRDGGAQ